jgi:hypothetical protein
MDGFSSQTSTVPGAALERGRSTRLGHRDGRRPAAPGATMAAHPHVGVAPSRTVTDRRGPGGGDVFARSAAGRLAVSGAGPGCGADRRPAAEAAEAAGHPAASRNCRPGVWSAPCGLRPMDHSADDRGSDPARDRGRCRPRDGAASARPPRAKAVAGKKCGASPRWTPSTSRGWRTC